MQLPFVPSFPPYTGPFQVGSLDVEVPIESLTNPAPNHQVDSSISTVNFRVFYPSEKANKKHGHVHWISEPQKEHVKAFATFLGAGDRLSSAVSYIPNLLYYTSLPVLNKATLLKPTLSSAKWPVAVFSHGLGGSRNSYSHICGSLASHGLVVIAPEHRDGSAPLSIIRGAKGNIVHRTEYKIIPHTPNQEVHDARNDQLRVRLWEMGLIHNALEKLGAGELKVNYAEHHLDATEKRLLLAMFHDRLDLAPGKISWLGHSFGAGTVCQFMKSVFYRPSTGDPPKSYTPIYVPLMNSSLVKQITTSSTLVLLDPWGLPLVNKKTAWLNDKPLPGYRREKDAGRNILAVLSEAFFKWNANLVAIKRLLSEDPSAPRSKQKAGTGAYVFYPAKAAHLSQSDFGVLFPTLIKLAAKAEEPERILRLNVRAILEVMRQNNIDVAATSAADMELSVKTAETASKPQTGHGALDKAILKQDDSIRGWIPLSLGSEKHAQEGVDKQTGAATEPMEAAVEGRM